MAKSGTKSHHTKRPTLKPLRLTALAANLSPVLLTRVFSSIDLQENLDNEELEPFLLQHTWDWKRQASNPRARIAMVNIALTSLYPVSTYSFTLRLHERYDESLRTYGVTEEQQEKIARRLRQSLALFEESPCFWFTIQDALKTGFHLHGVLKISPNDLPKLRKALHKKMCRGDEAKYSALQFTSTVEAIDKHGLSQSFTWSRYSTNDFPKEMQHFTISTPLTNLARECCNNLNKNVRILRDIHAKAQNDDSFAEFIEQGGYFSLNPDKKAFEKESTDQDPKCYFSSEIPKTLFESS